MLPGLTHQITKSVFLSLLVGNIVSQQFVAAFQPAPQRPKLVLQTGHANAVSAVAFSPDGRQVLTGSFDKTAILWDAETGALLREFKGHVDNLRSAAFSPNGRLVLTRSWKTAILWDVSTGKRVWAESFGPTVNSASFSSDGRRILIGAAFAYLLDTKTGATIHRFGDDTELGVDHSIFALLSPAGDRVVTGAVKGVWSLWDAATGSKVRTIRAADLVHGFERAVTLTPDGKSILAYSQLPNLKGSAYLRNVTTGRITRTVAVQRRELTAVKLSDDGRRVLTGTPDGIAILWDTASGGKLQEFKQNGAVWDAAFCPDGKSILTGSTRGMAFQWDILTGKKIRTFGATRAEVESIAVSQNGKRLATGIKNGKACVWDIALGKPSRILDGHGGRPVATTSFSPDGGRILTGAYDRAILWDTETGAQIHNFFDRIWNGSPGVDAVAFSPDGSRVLTGFHKGDTSPTMSIFWNARTGQRLHTLPQTAGTAAFNQDGSRVLLGQSDGKTVLFDAASGAKLRTFSGHHYGNVTSMAFSTDGNTILTGSSAGRAILWDAHTGDVVHKLESGYGNNNSAVYSVTYSPDGLRVLTGLGNKAALWDASTGRRLRLFSGHSDIVRCVAFSPDGGIVLTGASDGTARLWDTATGDELLKLLSVNGEQDWVVVTPDGLFDASPVGRQSVTYRVGNGLNVVPVDRFFQDFYYPGLLAAIWRGERPMPNIQFAQSLPPELEIVFPERSGNVSHQEVTLTVEATDTGSGILGPFVRHNGARVQAKLKGERTGDVLRQSFTVALVEGENRIRVEAASGDGSWESEPATLTLNYAGKLQKPNLYLVSVGINKYADEAMNLAYAQRDAEAMSDLFQQRGETLYEDVRISTLVNEQATKRGIREVLESVAAQAEPQDTLLVFLSGHGFTVGQRYYFIPHEFQNESARFENDVRDFGYPIDELADALGEVAALKRMLILDTCNSGSAIGKSPGRRRNPFAFRGAIERLSRAQGIFTIAAAAASEETIEIKELRHGVLTYSLLAGLQAVHSGPLAQRIQQQTSGTNTVGALEWFGYANEQVPLLTKKYLGAAQDIKMSAEGNSFPVLPLKE